MISKAAELIVAPCCVLSLPDMFPIKLCLLFQAEFTFRPALQTLPSSGSNCCSAAKVRNRSRPTLGQAGLRGMSQLQYHCPVSAMAAAPAPLPLGQPQPGYSLHCGSGTLPSESASQPVRSSALPAGSATPYTTTTGSVVSIVFIGKKYIVFV